MDIFRLPTIGQLKVKLGINNPGKGNIHLGYASIGLHVDDYEATLGNRAPQGQALAYHVIQGLKRGSLKS